MFCILNERSDQPDRSKRAILDGDALGDLGKLGKVADFLTVGEKLLEGDFEGAFYDGVGIAAGAVVGGVCGAIVGTGTLGTDAALRGLAAVGASTVAAEVAKTTTFMDPYLN